MTNKPLDSIGQPDKMRMAAAQADGEKQRGVYVLRCRYEDCPEHHLVASDEEQVTCPTCRNDLGLPAIQPSVIITPDPPDAPACLWCQSNPATPEYDPYCSRECATASAVDDEVNR